MAIYRQLLLSTGGGVISAWQQDEQNNCATLAIGLGGTGVACLRNLKRQVYSRLQPDDLESPVPQYSHIQFLAVDVDPYSLWDDGALCSLNKDTEYFSISCGDIHALQSHTKTLAGTPECKWLKTEGMRIPSEPPLASPWSYANRQIGRLLLMLKSAEFVSRIQKMVTDAIKGLRNDAELVIHIFTGICGRTGSGIFLDVCYLVQEALARLALKGKALTLGYVFLPDVNLSSASIEDGSPVSRYIKANGFAAMKELDYCMNFWNNHGCWDQEYQGFHIGPIQDPPVKVCHLVSAHDIKGTTLKNGYSYAMNDVVSDYIMLFLVKPGESRDGTQVSTMRWHFSTYFKRMEMVEKTAGANYQYCLLGSSNAIVPMREISTYLASKLFEEMSKVCRRKPTDQEVYQFAEKNELTYEQLKQALLAGVNYRMPVIAMGYKQFRKMSEEDLALADRLILPEIIMKPYRDRLQSNMMKQITTNEQAMTNEWSLDAIKKGQGSSSKVIAIYFALRELVVDPKYGPFYAADVLNGAQGVNLVNCLRGVQLQAENDLDSAQGDLALKIQAVKRARGVFLHGILSNKKKNFEKFMDAVAAYFTVDSYILALEQMIAMMSKIIRQFIDLYDTHFKAYQTVSRDLFDTFHENYQTLSEANRAEAIADPFLLPLMKIEDMKESLDAVVASMEMEAQVRNFHTFLFDRPLVWNAGNEYKISKEVSRYLVGIFEEYTGKTLTDYLEIRFNTNDPAKLANFVYKDILEPLKDKAEVLFWKASGFDITTAQPLGYISVPDTAAVVLEASRKLVEAERALSECPSVMKDRISIQKCCFGVPMYAYNGVNDCGRMYREDKTVGKHLYEWTERDARDWRKLSDLRPYSTDTCPSQEMEERAANYDRAVECGIVRQNPFSEHEYQIVTWPSIDQLVQDAEEATSEKNVGKIKWVMAAIEDYQNSKEPERIIALTNDGAYGHEEKVRKDHAVDSWEMSSVIREELDKVRKLDETLQRLDAARNSIEDGTMSKENFFHALYVGVITVNIPKVLYSEEEFEMTKEVPLSEPRMEPAGKFVPLYQAYLTYMRMTGEDRNRIDAKTNARLCDVDTWQSAMQDSCNRLLQTFSDKYLGLMQQQAAKLPKQEREIIQFLSEFRQGIDDFKMMYGLV